MYYYLILAAAVAGLVINIVALVLIIRRQSRGCARNSMFHDLLKILMFYDVFVVICCALHFAMPRVSGCFCFPGGDLCQRRPEDAFLS